MKTTILKFTKITLSAVFLTGIAFTAVNCSKSDDAPTPAPVLPALPATVENNTLVNIPDATGGGCGLGVSPGIGESTIQVAGTGVIVDPTKISIEVDIAHAWHTDVVLALISPSGDQVALIKRIAAASDTGCGTDVDFIAGNKLTFRAGNVTPLTAPYVTGNYAPTSGTGTFPNMIPMANLTTFMTGKSIQGTWKLRMYDYTAGDIGAINSWKIKFDTGAF